MMKALKILAYGFGILILLLGVGAAYVQFRGIPQYAVAAPTLHMVPDSARVAEGKRLVGMTCAGCHRGDDGRLSGRLFTNNSDLGKHVYAPNLTQHPTAAMAGYTDGELAYLLRTGIKRSGEFCPPWMPRFNHLSDDDLAAVIAYLRSDDEAVQPVAATYPAYQPSFLVKALTNTVMKPLPYPAQPIPTPEATNAVAYGRYLMVGRYECFGCHSPSFDRVDHLEPEHTPGYLSGGNPVESREFQPVHSANLTPDPETGLGQWTEAQFVEAVRFARRPDGRPLRDPMQPYAGMSEAEARAIWAYLQTVPAIAHPVERNF